MIDTVLQKKHINGAEKKKQGNPVITKTNLLLPQNVLLLRISKAKSKQKKGK